MRTLQRSLLTIAALSMFSSPSVLAQDRGEESRSRTGTESTSGAGSSSRSGSAQGTSSAQGTQGSGATSTRTQQGTSAAQQGTGAPGMGAQGTGAQGTAQQKQQQQGTAQQNQQQGQAQGTAQRQQERASGMMGTDTGQSLSLEQRKQIQQRLRTDGYYDGEIDGVIGQSTKDAVRQFQQANQLPATGQINQQTLAALGVRGGGAQRQGREQEQETRATGEAGQKTARLSQEDTVTLTDLDKSQVEALQRKLEEYGLYQGEIDGQVGAQTRRALQAFYRQQAQLVANGKLLSDSATALTGDESIQRVRGEDEDEESEEQAEKQRKREQERREQEKSQGQTRGTSGQTQGQQQQGAQGQRQQQQPQQQGAQGQSGWRRGGTTTPDQQMPEGRTQEDDDTMRRPADMPDNPR